MMRVWFTIALIAAVALGIQAAPILDVSITPPEAPFHHAFTYSLIVEGDGFLECQFPDIPTDDKKVEVRKAAVETIPLEDSRQRIIQRYIIDPIFPGKYVIPALSVTYNNGEEEGTLTVPRAAFHARELTSSEAEAAATFAGITSPDAILPPQRFSTNLWIIVLLVGILILISAFLVYRYLTRKKEAPEIVLPPWDVALNRLRELDRRNLPGSGKIDTYYVDLSAILRYYIEDRFHIRAPEQTTQEFLDMATQSGVYSEEQQQFLSDFLRQCDRVKFARLQPGLEDMTTHFKQVRHFIKDTMPADAAETDLEEAA